GSGRSGRLTAVTRAISAVAAAVVAPGIGSPGPAAVAGVVATANNDIAAAVDRLIRPAAKVRVRMWFLPIAVVGAQEGMLRPPLVVQRGSGHFVTRFAEIGAD